MCLYPRKLKNRRYQVTKKNGGNPPLMPDSRMSTIGVPCGKCSVCVEKKQREWRMRISEENKDSGKPLVLTLTFKDERLAELREMVLREAQGVIPEENVLLNDMMAKAIRLWSKAWHKKHGKSAKRWFISERGGERGRIHLHGFLWNANEEDFRESWEEINGFCRIGEWMGDRTIKYAVKYFNKVDEKNVDFKGRMWVSPGIGKGYMDRTNGKHRFDGKETRIKYKHKDGSETVLPRYYRDKIWSEEERIKLWGISLEENGDDEIWIKGVKYDKRVDNIEKVYSRERLKDKRLGFVASRSRIEQRYRNELKKTRKYKQ